MKKDELENLVSLDYARIKRLKLKGHYNSLVDEFQVLYIKFRHGDMEETQAVKFVTLCKFFMENGHTESFRLECEYLYKKYMEKFGL